MLLKGNLLERFVLKLDSLFIYFNGFIHMVSM